MTDGFSTFLAAAQADPRIELHSLLALHRGETVLEAYWEPWTADDRVHVYSVSKTVTGSAVGMAIGEGRLALDTRVVDVIEPPGTIDSAIAEITVHHLLSMSTGHTGDPDWPDDVDPVDAFYAAPPQQPVGSVHAYNNLASWMLGEVVRRVTGESLMANLRPRLFQPLGISPTWETDQLGRELGLAGLRLTTRELARIGELYRLGGAWQGRQLIPAEYVAAAGRVQISTGPGTDSDWTTGYGYQVWISREGYRLDGAYGQFSLVLPERESVIAITSAQSTGSQPLLDLVFEHLVPAVESHNAAPPPPPNASPPPPPNASPLPPPTVIPDSIRDLRPKPQEYRIPPVADDSAPGPWWSDEPTSPPENGPARITHVRLGRSGTDWTLTAQVDGDAVTLTAPGPGWHRTTLPTGGRQVPVAMSIGTDEARARVLLAFTATIHTLELDLGDGSGSQTWRTVPLGWPPIASLVAD